MPRRSVTCVSQSRGCVFAYAIVQTRNVIPESERGTQTTNVESQADILIIHDAQADVGELPVYHGELGVYRKGTTLFAIQYEVAEGCVQRADRSIIASDSSSEERSETCKHRVDLLAKRQRRHDGGKISEDAS